MIQRRQDEHRGLNNQQGLLYLYHSTLQSPRVPIIHPPSISESLREDSQRTLSFCPSLALCRQKRRWRPRSHLQAKFTDARVVAEGHQNPLRPKMSCKTSGGCAWALIVTDNAPKPSSEPMLLGRYILPAVMKNGLCFRRLPCACGPLSGFGQLH